MAKKLIGNFMQIVVFTAKVLWLCYFPGDTQMISIFKSFLSDYVRFSRETYQSLTLKVKACLPMFSDKWGKQARNTNIQYVNFHLFLLFQYITPALMVSRVPHSRKSVSFFGGDWIFSFLPGWGKRIWGTNYHVKRFSMNPSTNFSCCLIPISRRYWKMFQGKPGSFSIYTIINFRIQ